MVSLIPAQTKMPIISKPTASIVPKPTLQGIPDTLQQLIINFFSMKEIAQSLRLVQKNWRKVMPNDSLNLSKLNIPFLTFFMLVAANNPRTHSIQSMSVVGCKYLPGDDVCYQSASLPSLTRLSLPRDASDYALRFINEREFKGALKSLDLRYCHAITNVGLEALGKRAERETARKKKTFPLEHLDLFMCNKISSEGIKHISKFPLTSLDIGECSRIDDDALKYLSTCSLTDLKMDGCRRITDTGMRYLSKMPLKVLHLDDCNLISDTGFGYLNKMPLEHLELSRTFISDQGLLSLELPSLNVLIIDECPNITRESFKGLNRFPLKRLDFAGCRSLDRDWIVALSKLNIPSLNMPNTNINNAQLKLLSKMPLRDLDLSHSKYLTVGWENILLQFPALTTLCLTTNSYKMGDRMTIAVPIGFYFTSIHLLGKQIPTSRFSQPVGMLYETILEYLERKWIPTT